MSQTNSNNFNLGGIIKSLVNGKKELGNNFLQNIAKKAKEGGEKES